MASSAPDRLSSALVAAPAQPVPHLPLILERSIAAGLIGLLPVPYLDQIFSGRVRTVLIRQLAALHHIDLDANAMRALCAPASSTLVQTGTPVLKTLFRRVAAPLSFIQHVNESTQTFALGALFDHDGAHHRGPLTLEAAHALRRRMDQAIAAARSRTVEQAFEGALKSAARLSKRVLRRAPPPIAPSLEVATKEGYLPTLLAAFDRQPSSSGSSH